jgi:excisionase family DNA binding protein
VNVAEAQSPGAAEKEFAEARAYAIRCNPPVNMDALEASLYIGVSLRTLRDLLTARRIKYSRIGKRIVVTRIALDAFVEAAAEEVKA